MSVMVGDGPEGQPTEGVTLDSLAAGLDSDESGASEESAEEGEAAEGSEQEVESEESEESDESEAEEPTFTLKVNGKDITVTQSELIELGQKGSDYSQKTMAVAEERKAVEAEKAQAAQFRQQQEQALGEQIARLQALERFYTAELGNPPPISLLEQDSRAYLLAKEQYENRKGQLEQARQVGQQLQDQAQRERQAWIQQQADAAEAELRDTLPGWNEDTLNDLAKYAEGFGLTPDKVDAAFVQAGFWKALHKAKAYDALMEQKAKLKPVAQLPKVSKPGHNNQPPQLAKRQEAMKRHKAKPSLETLADLI